MGLRLADRTLPAGRDPPRPVRLYRIVHAPELPLEDFLSDEARGLRRRPAQRDDDRLYRGISMYSSENTTRKIAELVPQLGAWAATVDIPNVAYVEVYKTRGPDHYTVIGLPRILRHFVTSVRRVR